MEKQMIKCFNWEISCTEENKIKEMIFRFLYANLMQSLKF